MSPRVAASIRSRRLEPPGSPSFGELLAQDKANLQAPAGPTGIFVIAFMLSLLIFMGEAVRDAFYPRKTFGYDDDSIGRVNAMASVADLLDLWPSDKDVAERLHETEDMVRHWRLARAVPEDKARDLVEWALLRGHIEEVSRIAAASAPHYSETAALLHDLEKSGAEECSSSASAESSTPEGDRELDLPITRILEEMQDHRVFAGDPVARVRALRAEWDWRDEYHDRIRAGDHT